MEDSLENSDVEAEFAAHANGDYAMAGADAPSRNPVSSGTADRGRQDLMITINRLQAVLEEETASLQVQATPQLTDFIAKKNQALWDLSRALRDHRQAADDPQIAARISDLARTLAINRMQLHRHLSAAQEISDILTNAIRAAESDGTYTMDGRLLNPVR